MVCRRAPANGAHSSRMPAAAACTMYSCRAHLCCCCGVMQSIMWPVKLQKHCCNVAAQHSSLCVVNHMGVLILLLCQLLQGLTVQLECICRGDAA